MELREGGEGLWEAARTAYDEALQLHAAGRKREAASAARGVLRMLHGTDWRRAPPLLSRRARRLAFLCLKYVGTSPPEPTSAPLPGSASAVVLEDDPGDPFCALAALTAAARLDGTDAGVWLPLARHAAAAGDAPLAALAARNALRTAAPDSVAAPPSLAAASELLRALMLVGDRGAALAAADRLLAARPHLYPAAREVRSRILAADPHYRVGSAAAALLAGDAHPRPRPCPRDLPPRPYSAAALEAAFAARAAASANTAVDPAELARSDPDVLWLDLRPASIQDAAAVTSPDVVVLSVPLYSSNLEDATSALTELLRPFGARAVASSSSSPLSCAPGLRPGGRVRLEPAVLASIAAAGDLLDAEEDMDSQRSCSRVQRSSQSAAAAGVGELRPREAAMMRTLERTVAVEHGFSALCDAARALAQQARTASLLPAAASPDVHVLFAAQEAERVVVASLGIEGGVTLLDACVAVLDGALSSPIADTLAHRPELRAGVVALVTALDSAGLLLALPPLLLERVAEYLLDQQLQFLASKRPAQRGSYLAPLLQRVATELVLPCGRATDRAHAARNAWFAGFLPYALGGDVCNAALDVCAAEVMDRVPAPHLTHGQLTPALLSAMRRSIESERHGTEARRLMRSAQHERAFEQFCLHLGFAPDAFVDRAATAAANAASAAVDGRCAEAVRDSLAPHLDTLALFEVLRTMVTAAGRAGMHWRAIAAGMVLFCNPKRNRTASIDEIRTMFSAARELRDLDDRLPTAIAQWGLPIAAMFTRFLSMSRVVSLKTTSAPRPNADEVRQLLVVLNAVVGPVMLPQDRMLWLACVHREIGKLKQCDADDFSLCRQQLRLLRQYHSQSELLAGAELQYVKDQPVAKRAQASLDIDVLSNVLLDMDEKPMDTYGPAGYLPRAEVALCIQCLYGPFLYCSLPSDHMLNCERLSDLPVDPGQVADLYLLVRMYLPHDDRMEEYSMKLGGGAILKFLRSVYGRIRPSIALRNCAEISAAVNHVLDCDQGFNGGGVVLPVADPVVPEIETAYRTLFRDLVFYTNHYDESPSCVVDLETYYIENLFINADTVEAWEGLASRLLNSFLSLVPTAETAADSERASVLKKRLPNVTEYGLTRWPESRELLKVLVRFHCFMARDAELAVLQQCVAAISGATSALIPLTQPRKQWVWRLVRGKAFGRLDAGYAPNELSLAVRSFDAETDVAFEHTALGLAQAGGRPAKERTEIAKHFVPRGAQLLKSFYGAAMKRLLLAPDENVADAIASVLNQTVVYAPLPKSLQLPACTGCPFCSPRLDLPAASTAAAMLDDPDAILTSSSSFDASSQSQPTQSQPLAAVMSSSHRPWMLTAGRLGCLLWRVVPRNPSAKVVVVQLLLAIGSPQSFAEALELLNRDGELLSREQGADSMESLLAPTSDDLRRVKRLRDRIRWCQVYVADRLHKISELRRLKPTSEETGRVVYLLECLDVAKRSSGGSEPAELVKDALTLCNRRRRFVTGPEDAVAPVAMPAPGDALLRMRGACCASARDTVACGVCTLAVFRSLRLRRGDLRALAQVPFAAYVWMLRHVCDAAGLESAGRAVTSMERDLREFQQRHQPRGSKRTVAAATATASNGCGDPKRARSDEGSVPLEGS